MENTEMDYKTECDFVLRIVDKHSRRHKDGCPASQIPLACSTVVQGLVAKGTLKVVRGGRTGTAIFLAR